MMLLDANYLISGAVPRTERRKEVDLGLLEVAKSVWGLILTEREAEAKKQYNKAMEANSKPIKDNTAAVVPIKSGG